MTSPEREEKAITQGRVMKIGEKVEEERKGFQFKRRQSTGRRGEVGEVE